MIWPWRKKDDRIDPVALARKAEESKRRTNSQQPRVNSITSYLHERKNQNGFGDDFEYTLRRKPLGGTR